MPTPEDYRRLNRAAYESYASAAEAAKRLERDWARPLIERFAGRLDHRGTVIDLGCGPGLEMVELRAAGLSVIGLDFARQALRIASSGDGAGSYVLGDLTQLPFRDGAFDGAWATSTLNHLTRDDAAHALREARRVLRHGAVLYSSMQVGSSEGVVQASPREPVRAPRYYAFYEPDEWRTALRQAGFAEIEIDVELLGERAAEHGCNAGGSGWINATAVAR